MLYQTFVKAIMRHEGVIKIRRKIWFKMQENGCKGNIDWEKPIYTAEEVKILLDISDNTFRRWIAEGLVIPSYLAATKSTFKDNTFLIL